MPVCSKKILYKFIYCNSYLKQAITDITHLGDYPKSVEMYLHLGDFNIWN